MKDPKIKERFVELRAEGRSFDSIAKELGVSKTTLLKWNAELLDQINNAKFFYYQSLAEQFKVIKQERINNLMRKYQKVNDALDQKDFNELPVKELLNIQENLENKLRDELSDLKLRTGEFESDILKSMGRMGDEQEIIIRLE